MKVYLAGKITGLTYEQATDWRMYASRELFTYGIRSLDPMRDKQFLQGQGLISSAYPLEKVSEEYIFESDIADIDDCDILLCNLEGVGLGTSFELGYAFAHGILSVVFNVPVELKAHPFIIGNGNIIVESSINSAIRKIKDLNCLYNEF